MTSDAWILRWTRPRADWNPHKQNPRQALPKQDLPGVPDTTVVTPIGGRLTASAGFSGFSPPPGWSGAHREYPLHAPHGSPPSARRSARSRCAAAHSALDFQVCPDSAKQGAAAPFSARYPVLRAEPAAHPARTSARWHHLRRGCRVRGPGQKTAAEQCSAAVYGLFFYRPRHSSGRRRLRSCSAASMVRNMASLSRFSVPFSTR